MRVPFRAFWEVEVARGRERQQMPKMMRKGFSLQELNVRKSNKDRRIKLCCHMKSQKYSASLQR
jgi:hypothetical protein